MMKYQTRIGVAGMHGKSTCTSMLADIFMVADVDPTVISGATLREMNGAYRVGGQEHFIFEACEYMDSFLDFNPTIAVLLNIELEHVDYFRSIEQIERSYAAYATLTGKDGYAVANWDDEHVRRATDGYEGKIVKFGLGDGVDITARQLTLNAGCYAFDLVAYGHFVTRVELSVCGRHNVYNALAAAAVSLTVGIPASKIAEGLHTFRGAGRRMEYKGRVNGAAVYDDYGHHPTEVKATLTGALELRPAGGRLVCVFQPHTYSRTAALADDLTAALTVADRVVLTDIYAAREKDTGEISSRMIAEKIGDRAVYAGEIGRAAEALTATLTERDLCVVMGAGDINKIYDKLPLSGCEES